MINSHRISLSDIYSFVDGKNDSWFCDPQGVEIVNDDEGNVWATRGSKNAIFVKVGYLHLLPVVLAVVCFKLVSTFQFCFFLNLFVINFYYFFFFYIKKEFIHSFH